MGTYKRHGRHVGRPLKYLGFLLLAAATSWMGFLLSLIGTKTFPEIAVSGVNLVTASLMAAPVLLSVLLALKNLTPLFKGRTISYVPPLNAMYQREDRRTEPLLRINSKSHPGPWRSVVVFETISWIFII